MSIQRSLLFATTVVAVGLFGAGFSKQNATASPQSVFLAQPSEGLKGLASNKRPHQPQGVAIDAEGCPPPPPRPEGEAVDSEGCPPPPPRPEGEMDNAEGCPPPPPRPEGEAEDPEGCPPPPPSPEGEIN